MMVAYAHMDHTSIPELAGRRNFSVRLPETVAKELDAMAKRQGVSMNKLIGTAVANLLERPDLAPAVTESDISTPIARDALRQGPEAIGPLKGIATHAANRDQVALACVLWAAAARLVASVSGLEAASKELTHTADTAERSGRPELSVALYEEALRLDVNNLEAASRLGQRLHHLAQRATTPDEQLQSYRDAEVLLARVSFIDDHAKLFHGWSALHVARADGDRSKEELAVREIDEAMRRWAFGERNGFERTSWLRQIDRLREAELGAVAAELIDFANRNARWEQILQ